MQIYLEIYLTFEWQSKQKRVDGLTLKNFASCIIKLCPFRWFLKKIVIGQIPLNVDDRKCQKLKIWFKTVFLLYFINLCESFSKIFENYSLFCDWKF